MTANVLSAAVFLVLTVGPAAAQRGIGGSGDPTVQPAGDPHGAIKSMSQASEAGRKPDHSVTTVPNVVPSATASRGSGRTAE